MKKYEDKFKTWNLKIYGQDVFDAIDSGRKSIETRAGKPTGSEKYWGDFNIGDHVTFTLADSKTDLPVQPIQTTEKVIINNTRFESIDHLLKERSIKKIAANGVESDYRQWWETMPELKKRIEKYGIWAIELKNLKYRAK